MKIIGSHFTLTVNIFFQPEHEQSYRGSIKWFWSVFSCYSAAPQNQWEEKAQATQVSVPKEETPVATSRKNMRNSAALTDTSELSDLR